MTMTTTEKGTASGPAPPPKEVFSTVLRHLEARNVSSDDVEASIRVLNAIAALHPKTTVDGLRLYKDPALRPFRKALASCLDVHKLTMYAGENEDAFFEKRNAERSLKRQKVAERAMQKQYIAKTALRQGRLERLAALQRQQPDEEHAQLLIADGHVNTHQILLEGSGGSGDGKEDEPSAASPAPMAILPKLRSCYCCKVRYRELHHFYDQLCPACAALNFAKRHALAPSCAGKVAVVTGARVKIGFQTVLKLLRSGAHVVATSRFPNSAVDAYRKEPDFAEFQDRLSVYGLDLRDVTGIEAFTRFLKHRYPSGVDILIHNACQTIRRPVAYYIPLVEQEQSLWRNADGAHRQVLSGCVEFERARRQLDLMHRQSSAHSSSSAPSSLEPANGNDSKPFQSLMPSESAAKDEMIDETVEDPNNGKLRAVTSVTSQHVSTVALSTTAAVTVDVVTTDMPNYSEIRSPFESTGVSHSAAMSQVVLLPEDAGVSDDVLPRGAVDINGQQLDLRNVNSWVLKMDQVSTPEVMECFFVNAIAPFVLNSRLKPLMCFGDDSTRPNRFIVNVSAMEGKFTRYKTPNHPHTNMAKSALNMLTRTASEDLAVAHRIYMNSVDTGWINDENPLERAKRTAQTNHFQTPIDEVDAAARILDPIFSSLNGEVEVPVYGKFLKDYKETEW
jgi:NAD(P)-dependent dehydrogenase (short-subunit alcohol dehydrogenase family)